ncbi:MAG: hypothetical protein WC489_08445 [Patescibacteria group bacterium]
MRRRESAFRRALVQELRKHGAFVVPLESGETAIGIPDLYGCAGSPYFLELKVEKGEGPNYKRKIAFRPGQFPFLTRNEKEGGRSFIGIQYENGVLFSRIFGVDQETRRFSLKKGYLWVPSARGHGEEVLRWLTVR